jgi:hypothetical protein
MLDPNFVSRIDEIIRARGAGYQRLVAARRERERKRKRDKRKRQTSDQRERERVRKQKERERRTPEQREREKERERSRPRTKLRPFMAIDGEGGGTDEVGRQNYLLMIASGQSGEEEYILRRKGRHLLAYECLEFILSLPADHILVGYGFGYDSNQILRGILSISPLTARRILNPVQGKNGHGPLSAYWGDYAITYQQGQFFRVARVDPDSRKLIKGSSRTVYETLVMRRSDFFKARSSRR